MDVCVARLRRRDLHRDRPGAGYPTADATATAVGSSSSEPARRRKPARRPASTAVAGASRAGRTLDALQRLVRRRPPSTTHRRAAGQRRGARARSPRRYSLALERDVGATAHTRRAGRPRDAFSLARPRRTRAVVGLAGNSAPCTHSARSSPDHAASPADPTSGRRKDRCASRPRGLQGPDRSPERRPCRRPERRPYRERGVAPRGPACDGRAQLPDVVRISA
jgi:hypothetical protein